jgi:hypothetical protein
MRARGDCGTARGTETALPFPPSDPLPFAPPPDDPAPFDPPACDPFPVDAVPFETGAAGGADVGAVGARASPRRAAIC